MKKSVLLVILAVFAVTGLYAAQEGPLRMLFLGNSLTYVNDLPNTLRQIAAAEGITISVTTIANGGWSLNDHLNSTTSTDAINVGGWDYVVLQEQSQTSAYFPSQFAADVAALNTLITATGARTVLYQNWPLNTEMSYQPTYQSVWRSVAANLCAVLVPAGDAWYDLYLHDNSTWVGLYSDDRHPTQSGTYLTAATFFSVLFGRPTVVTDPVFGLGAAASTKFQATADAAVAPWRAVASVTAPVNEATEGGSSGVVRFAVSLTDICDTIIYYSLSGTAIPGADTTLIAGHVVIPAGATSVDINVDAINDGIIEGDETLIVALWGGPYYSVGTQGQAVVTLHDAVMTGTPTQTHTSSATSSSTQTPSWTNTVSPTASSTPTVTATSSQTPTSSLTSLFTFTQTFTDTFTRTNTATETMTPNYTFTHTPTPTATLQKESGVLEFTGNKNVLIYPNPNYGQGDMKAGFGISKSAVDITLSIYTGGFRHVADIRAPGSYAAGLNAVVFSGEKISHMANGTYFYVAEVADSAGNRAKSRIGTLLIIR